MERGFQYLGFDFNWHPDRQGVARVTRRTLAKKLQGACQRINEWIKLDRHLIQREFFRSLNRRLRGHYNYYGVRGNYRRIHRFYRWAIDCAFKWLNRRGGKRASFTWEKFLTIMQQHRVARLRITEKKHRGAFA